MVKSIFSFIIKLNERYNNNIPANNSEGKDIEGPALCSKINDKGIKKMVIPKKISLLMINENNSAIPKIP
jgi:hypothetical protein